ncbi:MAG: porin [Bacteroidales bacterium]|jgi:phosphate-selective porin|nr:porin [Bacteroidales bacterium]
MKKFLAIIVLFCLAGIAQTSAQGCLEASGTGGPTVIGYIQPQFEYHFLGDDGTGNSLNSSTFKFNRARIGVAGSIPYDIQYYVLMETSSFFTGNPFLLDAFITYNRLGHWAKFSVGSFKSPISLELNTPCQALYTIRRSSVVDQLTAPNRDIGFMVSGGTDSLNIYGYKTFNLLKYSLAITNGKGLGEIDDNMGKNYSGRIVLSPWKYISIGASYLYGTQKPLEVGNPEDIKKRMGIDLELKYKNFMIQGEYLSADDQGSYTVGGGCGAPPEVVTGSIKRDGYFVQATYMTPWNLQPVFKYESFNPDTDPAVVKDIQNTMTFGLNYFINDYTRIQINYLYQAEEVASVEVPNDAFLIQFQVILK